VVAQHTADHHRPEVGHGPIMAVEAATWWNAPVHGNGVIIVVGAVMLLLSMAAARAGLSSVEVRVFHAVNGWPDGLYRVLWLPMQLGNLVVGAAVGVVVTLIAGRPAASLAVLGAAVLKLFTERFIRHEMAAHFRVRQRPGTSVPGAILRGDVPAEGPSFPSGHVLLAAAVACVVAAVVPDVAAAVAFFLAVVVAAGRVYVGAHNPLDVTAGFGAGLVIGGAMGWLVSL
jgi:membrane-associated phospholipid phosphatase